MKVKYEGRKDFKTYQVSFEHIKMQNESTERKDEAKRKKSSIFTED